ncbi:hypothetical protein G7009_00890 [Pseudomonas capeferrum]|uniref:hypothetical protein n=1 Tax=Pseudomonas capeferrum TaxID=1495066 RepID=UPI0015E28E5F|nr:hypothetical protein [Pseudomonas capeferrum]MBA1200361.1 hypothetical protein [Pseudomonas capeferrum]
MSMVCLAAYDSKGAIASTSCGPEETALATLRLNSGLPYIETQSAAFHDAHYVLNGKLENRPEGPAYLDGLTLKGVKTGSRVTIEGVEYTADGSDLELEFTLPGIYAVAVELWPYKKQEFIVEDKT